MRLLSRRPSGSLVLTSFKDEDIPPYAILSHTWTENEEVLFADILCGKEEGKSGYVKLKFCLDQAEQHGLKYCWIDTCCIDKSTPTELSTAITSMFRWYERATKCYVFLGDVHVPLSVNVGCKSKWIDAFQGSRWFTRGWTLQELLAPAVVEFYSSNGRLLGDKSSLQTEIHTVTNLPLSIIQGQRRLSDFSVDERMSWSQGRETTVKEDKVYSLFGLLGVFLSPIFGEGEEHARDRLRDEVWRRQASYNAELVQTLGAISKLPFPRNEHFVGGEGHLQALRDFFSNSGHRRMSIHGLGGCGKTALALEFAYIMLSRQDLKAVFWVSAASRIRFEDSYRHIAEQLRVPGLQEPSTNINQSVKNALDSNTVIDWLMIVDNVDDLDVLTGKGVSGTDPRLLDYIPHGNNGNVLFTSRSKKVTVTLTQGRTLELREMRNDQARDLLTRHVDNAQQLRDAAAVDEALQMLAHHPLAITQAAAFIKSNSITISEYVSLLRDAGSNDEIFSEAFADPTRSCEMENAVARTWFVSFEHIQKEDQLAADYLSFISCIDNAAIPRSILPSARSQPSQVKAIGLLRGYAFLTERLVDTDNSVGEALYDMHPLVHMSGKRWLDSQDRFQTWTAKAAARLEELIPRDGPQGREVWTVFLSHATYLVGDGSVLSNSARLPLLDRTGRCRASLGQFAAAEALYRQTLAIRQKDLGTDHRSTLQNMHDLAATLVERGNYKDAEPLARQTTMRREELYGPDHEDTLISMAGLSLLLEKQGKLDEAESKTQETLQRIEKKFGREHSWTLSMKNNLAQILCYKHEYSKAETMHKEVLEQRKKMLGPEHHDTLLSMGNLGAALGHLWKFSEAISVVTVALARQKDVFGSEHPITLNTMHSLAKLQACQGNLEEAESMLQPVYDLFKKVLGQDHPNSLAAGASLVEIYYASTKLLAAEPLCREVVARREIVSGTHSFETLAMVQYLAEILARQQKYDEAVVLYEKACVGMKAQFGEKDYTRLQCEQGFKRVLKDQTRARARAGKHLGLISRMFKGL